MIKDGLVDNISIWDGVSPWAPAGYNLVDITNIPNIIIGCSHDGTRFTTTALDFVGEPA